MNNLTQPVDYKKELGDLGFGVTGTGTVTFKDGKYSVDGSIRLLKDYDKLPVQFDTVTGDFYCSKNNLTSLKGAPETVGRDFNCRWNKLTNLDGGPETVGGDFYCDNNKLTSLDGAPKTVWGHFSCTRNYLTNLIGAPEKVGACFYCDDTLTNLIGAPKKVGGRIYRLSGEKGPSLKDAPKIIIGLSGFKSAGKDTVAAYLVTKGFTKVSFSSALKDVASIMFGFDRHRLEGLTKADRAWREQPDPFWSEKLGVDFSPRKSLTTIGTDVMTTHFYKDVWVAILLKKLSTINTSIVVTDVRFENEHQALKQLGAKSWRILNPKTDPSSLTNLHISETAHLDFDYDNTIKNSSTIDALKVLVDSTLLL